VLVRWVELESFESHVLHTGFQNICGIGGGNRIDGCEGDKSCPPFAELMDELVGDDAGCERGVLGKDHSMRDTALFQEVLEAVRRHDGIEIIEEGWILPLQEIYDPWVPVLHPSDVDVKIYDPVAGELVVHSSTPLNDVRSIPIQPLPISLPFPA